MIFILSEKVLRAVLGKVQVAAVAVTRKFFFALLIIILVESKVYAESNVEFILSMLFQEGRGGKQVIDGSENQELSLFQPMIFIDTQFSKTTNFHIEALYDSFSSASARSFDSTTGASSAAIATMTAGSTPATLDDDESGESEDEPESRQSVDINLSQKIDTWVFTPSAGFSDERDYVSYHGGVNIQKTFAEENFILSLGTFYYQDSVNIFDITTSRFTGWTPKITRSYNGSISQILSPVDLILVSGSYTRQAGVLSSNINSVVVPAGRISERLPDLREKMTGTLRYIHGFSELVAFHADYRRYADTWGITADTIEPSVWLSSDDEIDLLQIAYRYYNQRGTRYYGETFSDSANYMTSDSDLQSYSAHEVRLHYSHQWDMFSELQALTTGGTLAYYFRSNDLRIWIVQIGIGGVF